MQHEAFFTLRVPRRADGSTTEQYLCSFNQRAMRTVKQVTGNEPLIYLMDEVGGLERTQILAYACTESFRRGNSYQLTFDEWIDGPYLDVYGSPYWAELAQFVEELVVKTFPWVIELRDLVKGAVTKNAETGQSDPSPSTGSTDSSSPSNSG